MISRALVVLCLLAPTAFAADAKKLCVYDPSGANGDIFNLSKDYKTAAVGWGVEFTAKPYTDERTAAEDFKAGQCDAVVLTGVRARGFVNFAGSIEALGALANYDQLETVIKSLASAKGGALMKGAEYQSLAIMPAGSVWLFLRDRNIDSVSKLAGKRIATIDFDDAAKVMVKTVGGSMVAADIGTFAGMFNNGSVDAAYAPSGAYRALELYKGVGKTGGVVKYVLSQLTFQVVARSSAFSDEFATKSRQWAADNFSRFRAVVDKADKAIPSEQWVAVPPDQVKKYDEVFQKVRLQLRDENKVYDKSMLTLLRKVRCKSDAARGECAEAKE